MIIPLNQDNSLDEALKQDLQDLNIKYRTVNNIVENITKKDKDSFLKTDMAEEVIDTLFLNQFAMLLQEYLDGDDLDDDMVELSDEQQEKIQDILLEAFHICKGDNKNE